MKDFIIKNKDKIYIIFFTLSYALITAFIALHHENWRDENQVWLLCKNLSFIDLLKQLKFEGHPFLFFSIIYPFVKIGFSCKIVNIVSWIFMIGVVALILKKAPVNKLTRVAIIFTFPIMYQYVIIGRSYSLVAFLVIALCCLEEKRKQKPILYALILGLIANTHIMMVGLVCMITLTFYMYELIINRKNNTKEENKKILIGFIIIVISGLILLLQLVGSIDTNVKINEEISINNLIQHVQQNLLDYTSFMKYPYIINFMIILFVIIGFFDYRKQIAIFIGSIIFQLIVLEVMGENNSYILMTAFFILIYTVWSSILQIRKRKDYIKYKYTLLLLESILIMCSLLSVRKTVDIYIADYKYNYSCSYEMADYINKNLEEPICISPYDAACSSMIPYIENAQFWNIKTQEYYTYITWNQERKKEINPQEDAKIIEENFSKHSNIYYITCPRFNDNLKMYLQEKYQLIKLYQTNNALMDESYIIYKINL